MGPKSTVQRPNSATSLLSISGASGLPGVGLAPPPPHPARAPAAVADRTARPVAFRKTRRLIILDIIDSPFQIRRWNSRIETETPSSACGTLEGSLFGVLLWCEEESCVRRGCGPASLQKIVYPIFSKKSLLFCEKIEKSIDFSNRDRAERQDAVSARRFSAQRVFFSPE